MNFIIPVKSVRTLKNPTSDQRIKAQLTYCTIEIHTIPAQFRDFILDPQSNQRLCATTRETLLNSPQQFHLYSRPITIYTEKATYDNRKGKLFLELDNRKGQGIVLGSDILEVILELRDSMTEEVYVEFEFVTGLSSEDIGAFVANRSL